MNVIDKLVNYIISKNEKEKIKLYCLIQKSSLASFSGKYNFIECIENDDGFFNYKKFKNNKKLLERIVNIYFDEIYLPSSTADFNGFEDILMIISKINANRNIFFSCCGEIYYKKINFYLLNLDKYFGEIIYCTRLLLDFMLITIIYVLKYIYYFIKNNTKNFFRKMNF